MADARRLADQLLNTGSAVSRCNYYIDHIVAGGASDGTTAVYLNIGGTVQIVPYVEMVTPPAAGQMVSVEFVNSAPLIRGRVIGLP